MGESLDYYIINSLYQIPLALCPSLVKKKNNKIGLIRIYRKQSFKMLFGLVCGNVFSTDWNKEDKMEEVGTFCHQFESQTESQTGECLYNSWP